jgi:hypothetical protein
MQQNVESSHDQALSRRGEHVTLSWQRAHMVDLAVSGQQPDQPDQEEKETT